MAHLDDLNLIYQAARRAPLAGDTHEQVREAALRLQEALKPKKKPKKDEPKPSK